MMNLIEGQKEGAVSMEKNGLAEMRAQWSVQGLVTNSGGPPGGESRNARDGDLSSPPNKVQATLQRLPTLTSEDLASQKTCKG